MTGLLEQHSKVGLGTGLNRGVARKEHHALHRVAEGLEDVATYRSRFQASRGKLLGEWTPYYLTALAVPAAAVAVTDDHVPFFVVLRDPIDRFESGMRLWVTREETRWRLAPQIAQTQWAGMYADQLDAWARVAGRERLVVVMFEAMISDPQAVCDTMWTAMGLEPKKLKKVDKPTKTVKRAGPTHAAASDAEWQWPPTLKDQLLELYGPQVTRLRDDWGLDVSSWRNFSG